MSPYTEKDYTSQFELMICDCGKRMRVIKVDKKYLYVCEGCETNVIAGRE